MPLALHDPSFPALPMLFGLSTVGLLAGVVVVLVLALKSGGRKTGAPLVAGVFAASCGLGCAAIMTLATFVGLISALALSELIEHGPVRSIEVRRADAGPLDWRVGEGDGAVLWGALADDWPVHVLVKYAGPLNVAELRLWLEAETGGDVVLVREERVVEGGEELALLDFGLGITDLELAELEAELARELPFLELPEGVRIELSRPE